MRTSAKRRTASSIARELRTSEQGIGLIEIIISMLLLALLATALVPVLVSGLKQASSSATLATATQLANDELERARSWTRCSDLDPGDYSVTDARAVELMLSTTVGDCLSLFPSSEDPVSVPVTVVVTRLDTNVVVTSTTTNIFIAEL
jgi:type II secretory pathway pseudopilin PulG